MKNSTSNPITYFTADTHYGHEGMMEGRMSRPRPFGSVEEHDETLIANWNAVVRLSDEIWHLGDFAFGCSAEHAAAVFKRLNGVKRLVCGNHEQRGRRLPWASQHEGFVDVTVEGTRLFMCHYSMRAWPGIWQGTLHLFGHTHASLPDTRRSADVGVDACDFRPVRLDEIKARMARAATWPEELAADAAAGKIR
ncbi:MULTISPECIES: metallophosphoesterase family protein [Methylobacterium]|uniref:metallophosphoesterase family protein n=1 Tax=Methylobacterium TaxID=407 RepID=UPI00272E601F|nr:metallophosphoesterase family protein [Methylobacterium sp.]